MKCMHVPFATLAFFLMVPNLFAEDLPEPATSWTYPPDMPGSRVETYRRVGDVDLKAWIFEPDGHQTADTRPAIVFFFGGGWKKGSPTQFEQHSVEVVPDILHRHCEDWWITKGRAD